MSHQWLQEIKDLLPSPGKHFIVFSSILVGLVFWGLQELLQQGFICPNDPDKDVLYSCLFLIGPPVALTLLAALVTKECQICCSTFCQKVKNCCQKVKNCCQKEKNCCQKVKNCCPENWGSTCCPQYSADCWLHHLTNLITICYYGCIWIVVALLDGDCYTCMFRFRTETWNNTNGTNEMTQKEKLKLGTESRIIGIGLLLALVIIVWILNICYHCVKPYYQWEYHHLYAEEMGTIIYENLTDNAQRNAKVDFNDLLVKPIPDHSKDTQSDEKQPLQKPFGWPGFWKEISTRHVNVPRSDALQPTEETKPITPTQSHLNANPIEMESFEFRQPSSQEVIDEL